MVAEKSFALPEDAGLETVLLALTDLGNSFEAGDSERVSMPSLSASEMEKIRELSPVKVYACPLPPCSHCCCLIVCYLGAIKALPSKLQ